MFPDQWPCIISVSLFSQEGLALQDKMSKIETIAGAAREEVLIPEDLSIGKIMSTIQEADCMIKEKKKEGLAARTEHDEEVTLELLSVLVSGRLLQMNPGFSVSQTGSLTFLQRMSKFTF